MPMFRVLCSASRCYSCCALLLFSNATVLCAPRVSCSRVPEALLPKHFASSWASNINVGHDAWLRECVGGTFTCHPSFRSCCSFDASRFGACQFSCRSCNAAGQGQLGLLVC